MTYVIVRPGFGITPLTPAYGRDYATEKEVRTDWEAEKDFLTVSGRLINRQQFEKGSSVPVRYRRLHKVVIVQA